MSFPIFTSRSRVSPRTASRPFGFAIALVAAALLVACASEEAPPVSNEQPAAEQPAAEQPAEKQAAADGDYAFGTDREQVATAIEQAFSTKNAKASWDGDTFILAIDGDANEMMAGFTDCRVLLGLLNEDDQAVIEFPNGSVACEEVLAD